MGTWDTKVLMATLLSRCGRAIAQLCSQFLRISGIRASQGAGFYEPQPVPACSRHLCSNIPPNGHDTKTQAVGF
jgi:hypothetical protein